MEDFKIYSIRTVFKRLNSIQIRFYQMEFTRSAIKVNKLSCTLYAYIRRFYVQFLPIYNSRLLTVIPI